MRYSLRFWLFFGVVSSLNLNDIKRMRTDPTTEATTTTPTTTTPTTTTTTTTPTTTTTTPTTTTTTPTTTTTIPTSTTTSAPKYVTFTMTSPGDMLIDCTAGCASGWKYYGSKCYKKFDTAVTFADAQTACTAQGAHLVSIDSSAENDALRKEYDTNTMVDETQEAWIGLRLTSGSWKWVDGVYFSYTNWAPTQPYVPSSIQCAQMITNALSNATYKYERGGWKTYDCAKTSASYICEKWASS